eukprot:TRINITY_DN50239_c0_g1_i1.p1 TRINITY_DN50239_c0_g1~~TRINITY_DN50239_c0_g1_i1.p1  ORF type:complete len:438 (-),score=73.84 TRINITY_DN50239_c0_g1_i1:22-1335(-)
MASSVLAMKSPGMGASSPIHTPHMLAGGLAPWGPTPSPSLNFRYPAPIAENCSSRESSSSPPAKKKEKPHQASAEFTQELLMAICTPFLENMVESLFEAVRKQLEKGNTQTDDKRTASNSKDGEQSTSKDKLASTEGGPFQSLFDPVLFGSRDLAGSVVEGRKEEPLLLRKSEAEALSVASGSVGSSKRTSPNLPGHEPSGPNQAQSSSSSTPSVSTKSVHHDVQPVYLAWESVAKQSRDGQRWADQRLSPVISQTMPKIQTPGAVVVALGRQSEEEAQQEPNPESAGAVPAAASSSTELDRVAGAGEKSPMVCRHWKSKGWCRLEAGCKFLHPEHKRGVCMPTKAFSGNAGKKPSVGENARTAPTDGEGSGKMLASPQADRPANANSGGSAMGEVTSPASEAVAAVPKAGENVIVPKRKSRGARRAARDRKSLDVP